MPCYTSLWSVMAGIPVDHRGLIYKRRGVVQFDLTQIFTTVVKFVCRCSEHGTVFPFPYLAVAIKLAWPAALPLTEIRQGDSSESWNEDVSTLRQVLLSIQSLILVPDPYFNEPGYERNMGTAQGNALSASYNDVIKIATVRWAMVDQIENPKVGFEQVNKDISF